MAEPHETLTSAALAGIPHGFLTGIGHEGAPAPDAIVDGGTLVTVNQVHSPLAVWVEAPFCAGTRPRADALVTGTAGLVLGIVTADCAPVLLADRTAGIVAAVHAGWRGAHGGVIEATLDTMVQAGADLTRIVAAIGPAIAQPSYEVDAAFRAHFAESDARFFVPGKPGHFHFDLAAYVAHRLQARGIDRIDSLGLDTYTDTARFHSYRRATHRGEPTYGRQFSLIALPN